jgi:hypothetical protein
VITPEFLEREMKKTYGIFILLILFIFVKTAKAQTGLAFDTVQVQLWPEYDRPSMLVIYTFVLPQDQSLPASVEIGIPASVGEPSALAVLAEGTLVTREFTRTVQGDTAIIAFEADFPIIQLEYYDDSFSQEDQNRGYKFSWETRYPVGEFIISVLEPPTASGMSIQPELGAGQQETSGLVTYTGNLGSLSAGQQVEVSISYNKPDKTLTIESLQLPPQEQAPPPQTERTSDTPIWGWVVTGIGAVLLAGGAMYYYRTNNRQYSASRYRKKKRKSSGRRTSGPGQVFCHQCGHQAEPGDKFCRECGTRLRV